MRRGLLAVLMVLCLIAPAWAEKRVALVIGNSTYQAASRLPNPSNDAAAFAAMLTRVGFDSVDLKTDLTLAAFKEALRDFTGRVSGADVAVFYFAGHGLEVGGANLLVPVDARLRTDLDAEDETISIDRVLRALEPARSLRLVVLDACRENPFISSMQHVGASRSVSRGFQRIDTTPVDTMIAFATEPGSVAADGDGANSPFTTALVGDLATPGLDLRIALGKVRDDVLQATSGRQRPFVTGSLGGSNQPLVTGDAVVAPPAAKESQPDTPDSSNVDFEVAQRSNSAAAWQAFLRLHPGGPLATRARDKLALVTPGPEAVEPEAAKPVGNARPATEVSRAVPFPRQSYEVGGLNPYGDNFLALRTAPDSVASLITKLPPGLPLDVQERAGAWARVMTPTGQSGWVAARFVVELPSSIRPEPGLAAQAAGFSFVTGLDPNGDNWLALKSAPDVRSQRLMKLTPGTRLSILGRSGAWVHVQVPDGPAGWAAARYIGCCTAAP